MLGDELVCNRLECMLLPAQLGLALPLLRDLGINPFVQEGEPIACLLPGDREVDSSDFADRSPGWIWTAGIAGQQEITSHA